MKFNILKITICSLATLISLEVYAGNSGHGGGGFLCIKPTGTTAELLDFREGRKLRGLTINVTNAQSVETQLNNAISKYKAVYPKTAELLIKQLNIIKTPGVIHRGTEKLMPPSDTGIKELEKIEQSLECNLVGVAEYNDDKNILKIDSRIENLFSNTDKAGLMFHEALYRVSRVDLGYSVSSKRVRDVVAKVFSTKPLKSTYTLPKKPISSCESYDGGYAFLVAPSTKMEERDYFFGKTIEDYPYTVTFTRINSEVPRINMVTPLRKDFVSTYGSYVNPGEGWYYTDAFEGPDTFFDGFVKSTSKKMKKRELTEYLIANTISGIKKFKKRKGGHEIDEQINHQPIRSEADLGINLKIRKETVVSNYTPSSQDRGIHGGHGIPYKLDKPRVFKNVYTALDVRIKNIEKSKRYGRTIWDHEYVPFDCTAL